MLKTISAALLAVTVLAAPAMAANSGKTNEATAVKTVPAPATKATQLPADKAAQMKPGVLNANARMGHHHKHFRHHGHHHRMGALKTHSFSKVSSKHISTAPKRG